MEDKLYNTVSILKDKKRQSLHTRARIGAFCNDKLCAATDSGGGDLAILARWRVVVGAHSGIDC